MMKRPELHLRMSESDKGVHLTPFEFLILPFGDFPGSVSDPRDGSPVCGVVTSILTGHKHTSSFFTIQKLVIPLRVFKL